MGKIYLMENKHLCIDCKNKICYSNWKYGQKRCYSCSAKRKHKLKLITYPKRKQYYCIDCNNKVSFNRIRCRSCSMKNLFKIKSNHPRFGDHRFREKAANWQGGKSFEPYALGWNRTFKEQIRHRDGYKCQVCGKPEVESYRKLDVHHIDYDKMNINPKNLITLCQSCHMKTNGNRKYWGGFLNERRNIIN